MFKKMNNKKLLENITPLLLSCMAILVSISQCSIAIKQNKLTDIQTKIAEEKASPHFIIEIYRELNEENHLLSESLRIRNEGEIVLEPKVEWATYLTASITNDNQENKQINIPYQYYDYISPSFSEGKGLIYIIGGNKNVERLNQDTMKIEKKLKEENINNIDLHGLIFSYVEIHYKNIIGEKHVDYFYIAPIHGSVKLESEEGERIFKKYKEESKNISNDSEYIKKFL